MNNFKVYNGNNLLFSFTATSFVLFQPGYKVKNATDSYVVQIIEVDVVNDCINLYIV